MTGHRAGNAHEGRPACRSAAPASRSPRCTAVRVRQGADRLVDPLQVGAGEVRMSREKVLPVVAEGRVVDGSEQDRADRQVPQESIECGDKSLDTAAPVAGEAGKKVV